MAQRISITMPDDLYNRLQVVKHKINVSRTCQEAIMEQVNRIEAAESTNLIEFLRSGRDEYMKKFEQEGRDFAKSCVQEKEIGYEDFIALDDLFELSCNHNFEIDYGSVKNTLYDLDSMLWETLEDQISQSEKDNHKFDNQSFLTGFVSEVSEIWAELEDRI